MFATEHTRLVLLAGSQGGYAATLELLTRLPTTFPAAIVLLLHRAPGGDDPLPRLITMRTGFLACAARDGDRLQAGMVHVAPRDRDLEIGAGDTLSLLAPRPTSKPATADRLFGSAAAAMGDRTIAVVLSGRLDDGAAGVRALKAAGGRVLAQAPATAEQAGMPLAALATGCVDYALSLPTLAAALTSLVMVPGADALFRVRPHPGSILAV